MLSPNVVSLLRRAYENAQSLLRVEACAAHYGSDDWEKPFVPGRFRPSHNQWMEALRLLPAHEWRLSEALGFSAMREAGWSLNEIRAFIKDRDDVLRERGLYIYLGE